MSLNGIESTGALTADKINETPTGGSGGLGLGVGDRASYTDASSHLSAMTSASKALSLSPTSLGFHPIQMGKAG